MAVGGNLSERPGQTRAWPVAGVLKTVTGTLDRGLLVAGRENGIPKGIDTEPMQTATTINSLYQLGLPATVIPDVGGNPRASKSTQEPLPTTLTRETTGLVVSNMANNVPRLADSEPMGTVTTGAKLFLAEPDDALIVHARENTLASIAADEPVKAITAEGNQHWLVVANNGGPASGRSQQGHARDAEREVLGTQTGGGQHAVVTLRGRGQVRRVAEPMAACATVEQHALAEVMPLVEESTFRMLEPSEIGRGMVMHRTAQGALYVIHGTRRQQVRQLGNAVTPPVAAWIATRIRDALQ